MRLSPTDHIFTGAGGYPINFLFVFDGVLDGVLVRESLERTLEVFWPVASRLVHASKETLGFARGRSYGWSVQQSRVSPALDDLAGLGRYFKSAKSVPGENLLEVTLTTYPGGSCLGISLSHCVVDGYSYFMFLTAWSKRLRNLESLSPALDREKLVPAMTEPEDFDSDEIFEKTGFRLSEERRPGDEGEVRWEVVDYEDTALKKLYAEVASKSDKRISLNDVLCADIWKKLIRQNQKKGDVVSLSCAYDFRRVYPASGPLYFGNAIRGASFELDFDEALSLPVAEISQKIGARVRSMTSERVEDSLKCFEALRLQRGLDCVEHFHVADPDRGFLFTNLSRMPMLDLDFGKGPPRDFRILTPAKRACVILPLANGLRVQIAH